MDWQLVAPTLIELLLFVIVSILFLAVVFMLFKIKRVERRQAEYYDNLRTHLSQIESLAKNANNKQAEEQAKSLVITRHLQKLDEDYTELASQLREMKTQDPSLRLYRRAADLVKQGASIDEIIEACDIPRAEAEMLIMVHSQKG